MAAVLVVDVSGFTALTARLEEEHARRAADRLATLMDDLLGRFVHIVGEHDGAVIDIVGDSVQAMWTVGGTRDAATCVRQAMHAALAINASAEGAGDIAATAGVAHLPVRTGIAFGALTLALVGGYRDDWDSLAWGPALLDAARNVERAPAGGIAIDRSIADLAGTGVTLVRHTDWLELRGGGLNDPEVRSSVAGARGTADDTGWTAELRSVSLLFVRLFAAHEMAAATFDQVQNRVLLVQQTIAAHGGQLEKIHADEKGIAALVTFGLPPAPVAEAAPRALAAAVDLRREQTALGIGVAIGIATGKVRAGVWGARGHHTIYGGAANLAARCMQACEDEILSDAATAEQASDTFEFLPPKTRTLKGLGESLEIFGVGNAKRRTAHAVAHDIAPLAGRRAEQAFIDAFLNASSAQRVLLLDGDVGAGKSRLVAYAAAQAAEHGYSVLTARAGALGTRTPLFAWRDPALALLRAWARARNLRLTEALAALTQEAGENPELSPLVYPLFALDLSESAADAIGDPSNRSRLAGRFQALVLSQLLGSAKRLLVIEDAQYLDEASAVLAADLHTLRPDMRLLIAGRQPLGTVQTILTEMLPDDIERHTIGPLDTNEIAELIAPTAGTVDPEHPLVRWLQSRTGGNPLFTNELLRALPADTLRAGLVSLGAWRDVETRFQGLNLPQTIEAAAAARLGGQAMEGSSLLKAASVLGGLFDRDMLNAMDLPVAPDAIEPELEALTNAGLLVADGSDSDPRWRFEQDLVRDAVYASLPDRMRVGLHRKAVEYLEALPPARRRTLNAQIAYHWQEAGEPARALKPLRRAGLAANAAGAFADAISFFRTALDIVARDAAGANVDPLYSAQLNLDLCNAYYAIGDHHKAIEPGLAALKNLWRGEPASAAGWSAMAVREAIGLWFAIQFPSLYARERRTARERARNRLRCEAATRLSDCLYFIEGSLPSSLALSLFGVRAAERGSDLSIAAAPYAFLAYVAGLLRLAGISRFCSERPIADCQRRNDLHGLRRASAGPLLVAVSLGRWREAESRLEAATAHHAYYLSDSNRGMAVSIAGQFHRWIGELAQSRERFEELGALGRNISDDQFVGWSHMGLGRLALCEGDLATADAAFDKGQIIFGRMQEVQSLFIFESLRASIQLRQGRFDDVAASADALLERAEKAPLQFSSGDAHGALAEAMNGLLAHYGSQDCRAQAQRAMKRARQFANLFPIGKPIVALHDGQLASLLGNRRKAARLWYRGLKVAEALPMKYEAARLHGALAALPSLPAEVRATHKALADAFLAICGARELPPLPIEPLRRI